MRLNRLFWVRIMVVLLLSVPVFVNGQADAQIESKPLRTFQLSFLPGVGTDGMTSVDHRYKLSVNILGGITGGIAGLEVSGFANLNRGMIQGAQVAGFCNLVWGNVEGFHAAGYMNIVHGHSQGFNAAGFLNVVSGRMEGFQGAGFANVAAGSSEGFQGAGFANVSTGGMEGFQGAGFANVVEGNMDGFQGAGFANVTTGNATGFRGAGCANVVGGDADGFQGAGFANIAGGDVQGPSIAGFANAARDVHGMQLAGFVNIARRVDGLQLGFLNIADTVSGLPIGFLSLVRKGGYRQIEVSGSDALHTGASVRIGVARFYNIFSFGMRPFKDEQVGGFGYGIGTSVALSHQTALEIEAHSTWLHETNQWLSNEGEHLSELRLNFTAGRSCRFNIFAGPVLYHHRYFTKPGTENAAADLAPYTLAERQNGDYTSKWWIGGRGGVRISLH
jgi:hypothetical protein